MQNIFSQTRLSEGLAIVFFVSVLMLVATTACFAQHGGGTDVVLEPTDQGILHADEVRLSNVRQLTTGHTIADSEGIPAANYAEAYWSPDGKTLIYQSSSDGLECDQIFTYDLITGARKMISSGAGRTTCSFFTADAQNYIFSSTFENSAACPEPADMSKGYVWLLDSDFDIYLADVATGEILENVTDFPGYDAEGTLDWINGWLYFTSTRDTDIEIYRQQMDTGEVERLTDEFGYDGGPFINYDGTKVVYRRAVFGSDEEKQDYTDLLELGMIRPGKLELMVMDADGSNKRQLTDNGAANFAPYLHPDNETIIFCSNLHNPEGFDFDLYTVNINGGVPERITFDPAFDGFPMFSPDGTKLVFCSNRNASRSRETNMFVVDWVK